MLLVIYIKVMKITIIILRIEIMFKIIKVNSLVEKIITINFLAITVSDKMVFE